MIKDQLDSLLAIADDARPYSPELEQARASPLVWRGAVIVLLAFIAHNPAIVSGWNWQDDAHVTNNLLLRTWHGLARTWVDLSGGSYRPLSQFVLGLQYRLFASHAGGYHLVSFLLHAKSAILLWAVLRRLSANGAWLAAAIFSLHPINVQSVGWISQQGNILAGFFALVGVLAYLTFAEIRPPPSDDYAAPPPLRWPGLWYAISLAAFVAAILCNPAAAWVPLVVPVLAWWKIAQLGRRKLVGLAPFVLLSLILGSAVLALSAVHSGASSPSSLARISIVGRSLWFYAVKIVWPYPLIFVYPKWRIETAAAWQYLFPAAAIAALVILWAKRRHWGKAPLAAAACFILAVVPGTALIPNAWMRYSYIGDQFAYLASMPLIALVVAGIVKLIDTARPADFSRVLRLAGGTALVAAMGALTWTHATTFADEQSLWADTLAKDPASPVAHGRLGTILLEQGHAAAAIEHFQTALAADPSDVTALLDLGRAYHATGDPTNAIQEYTAAARIEPNNVQVYSLLAAAHTNLGNSDEAVRQYSRALELRPDDELLHSNLGQVLAERGKLDEAIAHYRHALKINAYSIPALLNLSSALFQRAVQMGDAKEASPMLEEAADLLHQVIKIDPNSFEAFMSAGMMLYKLKEFTRAESMFKAAITLRSDSPEAHNNLGIVLAAQGQLTEAIYHFGIAVDLKPEYQQAKDNLDRARQQRQTEDNGHKGDK